MAFHQQLVQILNRPIPLPAMLEAPIRLPKLIGEREVQQMETYFDRIFSWLLPVQKRTYPARKAAKLFAMEGTVKGLKTGGFCIDGTPFQVNEDTFVVGDLKADVGAKVKGLQMPDGKRIATAIVVKEQIAA